MSDQRDQKTFPLEEALRAQQALRDQAGLGTERFPVEAFVGMISDEVETLRAQGRTYDEIARTIADHSAIDVTPQELEMHYAPPERRHGPEA